MSTSLGFVQRITEQACIGLPNFVNDALDLKKTLVALFLDVRKAFDCLSHDILLAKFSHFGVRGETLKWLQSSWPFFFSFDPGSGIKAKADFGVPQVSILGPLLYIVNANDLYWAIRDAPRSICCNICHPYEFQYPNSIYIE